MKLNPNIYRINTLSFKFNSGEKELTNLIYLCVFMGVELLHLAPNSSDAKMFEAFANKNGKNSSTLAPILGGKIS